MDNSLTREELQKQLSESIASLKVEECHINDDLVWVVRCKNCVHSAYTEERITWCKRHRTYMSSNGYCYCGERRGEDSE